MLWCLHRRNDTVMKQGKWTDMQFVVHGNILDSQSYFISLHTARFHFLPGTRRLPPGHVTRRYSKRANTQSERRDNKRGNLYNMRASECVVQEKGEHTKGNSCSPVGFPYRKRRKCGYLPFSFSPLTICPSNSLISYNAASQGRWHQLLISMCANTSGVCECICRCVRALERLLFVCVCVFGGLT